MKNILILLVALIVATFVGTINGQLAHCLLKGTTNMKGLKGTVYFTQSTDGVTTIAWSIDQSSVPSPFLGKTLGFHIHEFGYIADPTASGGHYNPYGKNHSLPSEGLSSIHVGDLGNIDFSKGYSGTITSSMLQFNGTVSIIGRAMRLHVSPDLGSAYYTTNGNAGGSGAQCVIGLANNAANTMSYNDQYTGNLGVAVLQKTAQATTNVTGRVIFSYNAGNTRILGKICGLPPLSTHGLHIHTWGELDLTDGTKTGGHYNPFNKTHGYPGSTERHVGDLGNVTADSDGTATFDYVVDLIEITSSVRSIIGRGLVLHTTRDDGTSTSPTGNAGSRIAVGIIGIPQTTVTLASPVDACIDPAPPADSVIVAANSTKTATSKNGSSSAASFSMIFVALISFIVALL